MNDSSDTSQLLKEISILRNLDHPNIIRVDTLYTTVWAPAFDGETDVQIISLVKKTKVSLNQNIWINVSGGAKDLIASLVCAAPLRLTSQEALAHSWIDSQNNTDILQGNITLESCRTCSYRITAQNNPHTQNCSKHNSQCRCRLIHKESKL